MKHEIRSSQVSRTDKATASLFEFVDDGNVIICLYMRLPCTTFRLHFSNPILSSSSRISRPYSERKMGSASSVLTQYDIEEVQRHCDNLFSQQEIVSLYQRFCQLDRNAKGFISADEFLSVPEFAMNPLSQRLLKMVDGLNFKDFLSFLSAFSSKASMQQKIGLIFKVYDTDCNGKVSFDDIMEVLRDLSGSFMSDKQREEVLSQVLREAGYTRDSYLMLDNFIKGKYWHLKRGLGMLPEVLPSL
ncbi:calcineurin subunit B isoform X2 [Carica papaya]|uniref:calcineurin subunit B isoform X2 n=1 Tax=Carica papaya TaxID=3649 RepID=UPI000B8CC5B6|nr:calcineurin subunit B isoform X2 [Carica papaya]